jgi:hypothetical protein
MMRLLIITFMLCVLPAAANEPPELLESVKPTWTDRHPILTKVWKVASSTIYIAGSIAQIIAPFHH